MGRILFAVILTIALSARAAIQRETVEYADGDTVLEGTLVYDDAIKTARDGVIIFHEWAGPRDYELSRADQIAGLGYATFVADMYGKGVRPEGPEACRAEVMKYYGDRDLTRRRAGAALQAFKKQRPVFQQEFVAIGYCFGGMCALELARNGAKLAGVVSFHGSPDTPAPDGSNVKCPLRVYHGADDPHVTAAQVKAFEDEMTAAGVDFTVVAYPGAVHRFSNPDAGDNVASGVAYNKEADEKSWAAFTEFLRTVFD
jgi:dienelactone hydrolase